MFESCVKMSPDRIFNTDGKITYNILKDRMTVVNQKVDYTDKHHRLKWLNTIIGNIQTRDYSISSVKLRIFWYHIISKFTLDTLIIFWDYPLRPCSCTINRFTPMWVDKFIVSIFYESINLSLHIVSNQYITWFIHEKLKNAGFPHEYNCLWKCITSPIWWNDICLILAYLSPKIKGIPL